MQPARVESGSAEEPRIAVVVVAAGSGTRLGRAEPKAFVPVRGVPMIERAVEAACGMSEPVALVLVVPEGHRERAASIARDHAHCAIVPGGPTRQASVAAGLAAVGATCEIVLVHDAARCLTPTALFDRVAAAVREWGAGVVPALPVTDTIKRVDASGGVLGTVERSELVHVQTPQGFPRAALEAAYAAARRDYTDDAALFADAGGAVRTVPGEPRAFKITREDDLERAEHVLSAVGARPRTGIGIDVHAFDVSVPLWLGGLHWPGEPGLAGHSDGDAIAHAVCDALLSAAGLGDIGSRFGTSSEEFRDAHGEVFLTRTVALVRAAGFTIGNVAVQVVANRPRLGARRAEVERRLAELVGAPVSVAATTSDGLGFAGRGEGLTAIATALLS